MVVSCPFTRGSTRETVARLPKRGALPHLSRLPWRARRRMKRFHAPRLVPIGPSSPERFRPDFMEQLLDAAGSAGRTRWHWAGPSVFHDIRTTEVGATSRSLSAILVPPRVRREQLSPQPGV